MSEYERNLELVLIADDPYRIAMLRQLMRNCGLSCTIRRFSVDSRVTGYLRRHRPDSSQPELVLFDFAESSEENLNVLRNVAFGKRRSKIPVALLTSPTTERLLESGGIDDGEATMFSPRDLATMLRKLCGERRSGFLKALATLYEYGPILLRQPTEFIKPEGKPAQLSA